MTRPFQLPLFVLGVALGAGPASAAEFSPILQESAPAKAKPAAPRAISSQVAGMLAAAAPKYAPPDAPPAKPVETDPAETDRPRNGIIRLSPYVVRELKLPAPKERDMLTAKGRLELAYQRHPGLRIGSIGPFKNNVWATALLEEELGIERQKEMLDLLGLLAGPKAPPPLLMGRPPFSLPQSFSGPWGGLIVPWERK